MVTMQKTERLKKHQTLLLLNIGSETTPNWARIGYSTIFDLALNPNIVEEDFIKDENPTDTVMNYKPTLPQELATVKGDKAFDHVYNMFYGMPTGENVKRPVLIVFAGNIGTEEEPMFKAWLCDTSVILNNFNTVDQKITFDLNFNGTIDRGSAKMMNGQPEFASGEMFTVSFNSNGGSEVANIIVRNGEYAATPDTPTKVGYTFAGWFAEGSAEAFNFENTVITNNIVLHAQWTYEETA